MNKKSLIKGMLIMFALSFIFVGCKSEKIEYDERNIKILTVIKDELASTDDVLENVNSIIKWQTEGADQDLEKLKEAQDNYEIYDGASLSIENANKKYEEFENCIGLIKESKATIDNLEKTDVDQVNKTIEATKIYYERLLLALNDLNKVFMFNREVNAIISEMGSVDVASYNSGSAATKAIYESIDNGIEKLKAIDCPSFMQQVFDKEILGYTRLLEIIYEENIGYVYSDAMRLHAASNMYSRVNYELQKYRIDLLDDYSMQFKRVSERLNTQIMPLRDEINNNAEILLPIFLGYEAEGGN